MWPSHYIYQIGRAKMYHERVGREADLRIGRPTEGTPRMGPPLHGVRRSAVAPCAPGECAAMPGTPKARCASAQPAVQTAPTATKPACAGWTAALTRTPKATFT